MTFRSEAEIGRSQYNSVTPRPATFQPPLVANCGRWRISVDPVLVSIYERSHLPLRPGFNRLCWRSDSQARYDPPWPAGTRQ